MAFPRRRRPDDSQSVGFQSSPAIANGIVLHRLSDSNLYALDAATGKEEWRFFNDLMGITSPPLLTGKMFFATSDSSLYHVCDAKQRQANPCAAMGSVHVFVAGSPLAMSFSLAAEGVGSARREKLAICSGISSRKSKQNKRLVLTGVLAKRAALHGTLRSSEPMLPMNSSKSTAMCRTECDHCRTEIWNEKSRRNVNEQSAQLQRMRQELNW